MGDRKVIRLETERLIIRNFTHEDWQRIYEIALDYEKSEYAIYDHGPWPSELEEYKKIAEWFSNGDDFIAVVLKEEEKVIGWIAKGKKEKKEKAYNLGYILHSSFHGKGYATESCKAVMKYIFDELQANEIITGTGKLNIPSNKLLKRLGFKKIGESNQAFRKDEEGNPIEFIGIDYMLSRSEWLRSK
jgi:RimJ/RimL family protein N-acetyltransferase